MKLRPISGLAVLAIIIGGAIGLIIYSSISIVVFLRRTKVMSDKTRQLQYALFRMLAIQVVVIAERQSNYILGCDSDSTRTWVLSNSTNSAFVWSEYRILQVQQGEIGSANSNTFSDICTTIFSFLTPLDSLSVILLMKDYRRATISIVKCR